MIFNTWIYGLFLLATFLAYWLTPERVRQWLLIGAGAFFYTYYFPPHLILIAASMLIVFWVAGRIAPREAATGQSAGVGDLAVDPQLGPDSGPDSPDPRLAIPESAARQRRRMFILAVTACVGLLAYYKYQGFLANSINELLGALGMTTRVELRPLRAPLAISFFMFEYVHYLIEVYRGTFRPASFRDFALFIFFFPTLICGPIKRFQQFNPQKYSRRSLDPANIHDGLERILFGLSKKTLIADQIAPWCAPVFLDPSGYTWVQLWLAVYGYAMQIYFDFSGYSDIAIGSAKLFGYPVPENFNYPYLQANITQFWRSWHMSLTSWITDYLYIPLGGNRHGELRSYGNRLVAMTICGLWHGAAFHFMVWGLYHGVALNLYQIYRKTRTRLGWADPSESLPSRVVGALITFHVVCLGWVLFVCDLDKAWVIIWRLVTLT